MRLSRRRFLARGGAAGLGLFALPSARAARTFQAHERLNFAVVGVAGYAAATAFVPALHLYENVGVTALCDVDERKIPRVYEIWKERAATAEVYRRLLESRPKFFADFRRMLDEMGDAIDAVVVATPDHSHAVIAAAALRAGKHVLCEKPLTINVREARALRELAAGRRVATSMGNQGTQSRQFRRGVELVREGVLGDVEEVLLWFPRGGQNHRRPPQGSEPVPEGFHWDLWLGPVAWRPYHPRWIARCHWRDTGAGELGNFGPHTANLAFMALDVADLWRPGPEPARIRVRAEFSELNRLSFPRWEVIRWKVPARGTKPPVTFTWYHGPAPDMAPGSRERILTLLRDHGLPREKEEGLFKSAGAVLVGRRGVLLTNSHNTDVTLLPAGAFQEVGVSSPRTLPVSRGHYKDWVHACRGGEPPLARFEYAATFNEFLMLGPVATLFEGTELEYDPVAGRIVNSPEADSALGYAYREGWRL